MNSASTPGDSGGCGRPRGIPHSRSRCDAGRLLPAAGILLTGVLLAGGCLGYRLGSTLPPDIRTVHVPTFVNATSEPLLEMETTRALMNELRRDGSLRVTGAEGADARLEVRLVQYRLEPLRYERGSRRTVSEYRIALRAKIEFTRAGTGETIVSRTVKGESSFELGADLTSDKQAALPAAARDLARNIVETVVEYW